jgi:hypothetical protein
MSATPSRLVIGFAAGALSHLLFQGAYGSLLHAAQLLPALPWSLAPTAPFGVPQTLSLAFWAGLWGLAFGLVEPRLTPRFGRWLAALPVAALALLSPLVRRPAAEGLRARRRLRGDAGRDRDRLHRRLRPRHRGRLPGAARCCSAWPARAATVPLRG